jgi:hypothetical protein
MWTHANVDGQVDPELLRLQGRMRRQNDPLPTVSSPEMDAIREVSGQRFQAVERLEVVVSVLGPVMGGSPPWESRSLIRSVPMRSG